MTPKQTMCRLFCMAVPCAVILCLSPRQARGQNTALSLSDKPPLDKPSLDKQRVTLHIAHKRLTEAVTQLSDALGRGIVVDDEPSEQRFDIEMTGTGREALDAFANACDYSWSLNRSGLVLMRKAFHKPTTLPQMNLPEMRRMAQDAIDVFSAFHVVPDKINITPLHDGAFAFASNPNGVSWGSQLRTLARSFTPPQLEQLRAGNILHTADLSRAQGDILQQIVVDHAFGDLLSGWMSLSDALEQMPAISLEMRAMTEWRRGVEVKGIVLEQVRQGSGGKEIRTRLVFQPDTKPEEKKP